LHKLQVAQHSSLLWLWKLMPTSDLSDYSWRSSCPASENIERKSRRRVHVTPGRGLRGVKRYELPVGGCRVLQFDHFRMTFSRGSGEERQRQQCMTVKGSDSTGKH
jgi:hypothetical protein